MGWFGVLMAGSLEVIIQQWTYEFLLAFHSNYVPILHLFWDIARYWSKITDFYPTHLYTAHPSKVTPLEFFGIRKLTVPGLSYNAVHVTLCLATLVELRLVTDRQTDTNVCVCVPHKTTTLWKLLTSRSHECVSFPEMWRLRGEWYRCKLDYRSDPTPTRNNSSRLYFYDKHKSLKQ